MEQEGRGTSSRGGCSSACPLAEACGLPRALTRVALLLWQREYCENDRRFESCQRFLIARRGQPVPQGMLPNGKVAGI